MSGSSGGFGTSVAVRRPGVDSVFDDGSEEVDFARSAGGGVSPGAADLHLQRGVAGADHVAIVQVGRLDTLAVDVRPIAAGQVHQAAPGRIHLDQKMQPGEITIVLWQLKMSLSAASDNEAVVSAELETLALVVSAGDFEDYGCQGVGFRRLARTRCRRRTGKQGLQQFRVSGEPCRILIRGGMLASRPAIVDFDQQQFAQGVATNGGGQSAQGRFDAGACRERNCFSKRSQIASTCRNTVGLP